MLGEELTLQRTADAGRCSVARVSDDTILRGGSLIWGQRGAYVVGFQFTEARRSRPDGGDSLVFAGEVSIRQRVSLGPTGHHCKPEPINVQHSRSLSCQGILSLAVLLEPLSGVVGLSQRTRVGEGVKVLDKGYILCYRGR